jgi:hypothetical protein
VNQLTLRKGELIGVIQERGEWYVRPAAHHHDVIMPLTVLGVLV